MDEKPGSELRGNQHYVFILVSSEHSFLRPNVATLPTAFIDSGKVFFVYAEDFHEKWNHFGMLTAFRDQDSDTAEHGDHKKMDALFHGMFAIALGGKSNPFWNQACSPGSRQSQLRSTTPLAENQ